MDAKKIGLFLKKLRKEKELTQEQLAEHFLVSNRTVSRWETGSNLPELGILVELAEFHHVDIKEIIDGERKSENMNEEVKETAVKMADYANEQKSRLLIWIRRISLFGVILTTLILGIQTFQYEPGILSFLCYVLLLLILVIMGILTLYTNGMLEKIVKRKKFVKGCKITIGVVSVLGLSFILRMFIIFATMFIFQSSPYEKLSGIENYDKEKYIEEYGTDLDSELFIFPDETAMMIEPTFESSLKSGMFDTDGYIILRTKYNQKDYEAEVKRLSEITCTVMDITVGVKYDELSYLLPAYVASDGYCDVYEYALLDEKKCEITYVLLCYPQFLDMSGYEEVMKTDISGYETDDAALDYFTIYARRITDDEYLEYSDSM